jgi:hypothetical protein
MGVILSLMKPSDTPMEAAIYDSLPHESCAQWAHDI